VGTVTEIYDYLRLLFARIGQPHCPACDRPIARQTPEQIADRILSLPEGTRIYVMGPVVRGRKGEYRQLFEDLRRAGYVRARIDGQLCSLDEEISLDRYKNHTIEVVVDRLVIEPPSEDDPRALPSRLADSLETALKLGGGTVVVWVEGEEERLFSEHFACVHCGISIGEVEPRNFSFNSPYGACRECSGLGVKLELDPDLIIPNKELSLAEGAIQPWARAASTSQWYYRLLEAVAEKYGFSTHVPVKELSSQHLRIILYGAPEPVPLRFTNQYGRSSVYETTYEGVIPNLERRYRETESDYVRQEIERYMRESPCPACRGARLRPESLAVTVNGLNIYQVTQMDIRQALQWVEQLQGPESPLTDREQAIARQILKEIAGRLHFLVDVGLDYLTLERRTGTLAGGEAQRIRLATQIGSGLMGVLYVCDEPSIGLHPADEDRLIATLKRLRDLGNTVIVVEHDEAMIRAADYIVDLGPGAGREGGYVVATGTLEEIASHSQSITGAYLSGRRQIPLPSKRRPGNGKEIVIVGAREFNLKNITVRIPLGKWVCVTGVSGSGKSTLVYEILYKKAAQALYGAKDRPGQHDAILGLEHIDKVINIDQSPIGRTPRSNPATYTGVFTPIREIFASVAEARLRGYKPGRFSFNVKGGRCEACQGEGYIQIEMQFLPDVEVPCEVCHGQRYNRETLEITFRGKNIAQVLDMTVEEALEFFDAFPQVRQKLQTLHDVGLGYIKLGQPATTLSGGEAQRVKLAAELSRRSTGRTLYILDEPTTGLSFEDVSRLIAVLHRLVDAGNTVVVIEHHLDVIKQADYVIDLGPGGGQRGGYVVAEGTPEEVAQAEKSLTGQYLRRALAKHGVTARS